MSRDLRLYNLPTFFWLNIPWLEISRGLWTLLFLVPHFWYRFVQGEWRISIATLPYHFCHTAWGCITLRGVNPDNLSYLTASSQLGPLHPMASFRAPAKLYCCSCEYYMFGGLYPVECYSWINFLTFFWPSRHSLRCKWCHYVEQRQYRCTGCSRIKVKLSYIDYWVMQRQLRG